MFAVRNAHFSQTMCGGRILLVSFSGLPARGFDASALRSDGTQEALGDGLHLRQSAMPLSAGLVVQCRPFVVPDYTDRDLVSISATNIGRRPVKITLGYFMAANRSQIVQLPLRFSTKLPVTLQDGESAELFYDRGHLDEVATEGDTEIAHGFLTDTAGGVYKAWFRATRPRPGPCGKGSPGVAVPDIPG